MTTSAVTWTLDKKKIILGLLVAFFISSVAASTYGYGGYNGYSPTALINLDNPYQVLTGFVAPFLLITLIFQRGYSKALTFTLADEPTNMWPSPNEDNERARIKRFSMVMALATSGMIVPTPWFQIIRQWVVALFGTIGFLFFGALFAAFVYVLWKAFS